MGAALSSEEHETIVNVIKRNEALEQAERQRVGRLVDKLEKIKERAVDFGPKNCRLCGQFFRFLRATKTICDDCNSAVCSKCAIEMTVKQRNVVVLCKICAESREIWKKSGAWFYKALPSYDLPPQKNGCSIEKRFARSTANIRLNDEDSTSSSDDEGLRGSRRFTNTMENNLAKNQQTTASSQSIAETQSAKAPGSYCMSDTSSIYSSSIVRCSSESILEPPFGWIEVILNFNQKDQILQCTILRARDLPAMDNMALADPFCKLNVVYLDGSLRHLTWCKTKTVHKTRNPEFNETISFPGIGLDEILNSILFIVLLDDDKYGHDFLGTARMNLSVVRPCNLVSSVSFLNQSFQMFDKIVHRISIPLETEDHVSSRAVSEGPWPRGQILLALCYNTKKRSLQVLIKGCTNLISMDHNGFSDPFVKM